jgi:hypothetical protein
MVTVVKLETPIALPTTQITTKTTTDGAGTLCKTSRSHEFTTFQERLLEGSGKVLSTPYSEGKTKVGISNLPRTPVGRVPHCIPEWISIGTPEWILEGISEGFKVYLTQPPSQIRFRKLPLLPDQKDWVAEKILDYLERGNLVETSDRPSIISPFFLVPKDGPKKYRLVIDLRYTNSITLSRPKIKMENLEDFLPFIGRNTFMVTMDLQDYYLHFPLHKDFQNLIAIELGEDILSKILELEKKNLPMAKRRSRYLQFTTLTFGWKDSAYISIKIMKVVMKYLRSNGIKICNYGDDSLIVEDSIESCKESRDFVAKTFDQLGLKIQDLKTQWEPSQTIRFLGMILNSKMQKIFIPKPKMKDLYALMSILKKESMLPRRFLAKIAGKLNSVQLAFLPARYCTRPIYNNLNLIKEFSHPNWWWSQKIPISEGTKLIADWFLSNAKKWNGRSFNLQESTIILEGDASSLGFGCVLNEEQFIQGTWDLMQSEDHINVKELKTLLLGIEKWKDQLSQKEITIKTDNQVAYYYLKKAGGKIDSLNSIARKIWQICLEKDIHIARVVWIPSEENHFPDILSRGMDTIEWELSNDVFHLISERFGRMDIDRFASDKNTKLPRFNAWNISLGIKAEALDAFSQDWSKDINFVNAPFNLIPRILKLIQNQKANTIMLIPLWKGQMWFQTALSLASNTMEILLSPLNCFGKGNVTPEPLKNPMWKFLIIKICF